MEYTLEDLTCVGDASHIAVDVCMRLDVIVCLTANPTTLVFNLMASVSYPHAAVSYWLHGFMQPVLFTSANKSHSYSCTPACIVCLLHFYYLTKNTAVWSAHDVPHKSKCFRYTQCKQHNTVYSMCCQLCGNTSLYSGTYWHCWDQSFTSEPFSSSSIFFPIIQRVT